MRVLTAAVLLAAFLASLFLLGPQHFQLVVALIVAVAGYEWMRLCRSGKMLFTAYAGLCVLAYFAVLRSPAVHLASLLVAAAFWMIAVPLWLTRGLRPGAANWLPGAGLLVLVPAGVAMALISPVQLLQLIGLSIVADSAAYFAGHAFGRRKLAPAISPGKTWEGAAGGAIGCVIYAIIWAVFDEELRVKVQGEIWIPFLAGTMVLCALSVVGDLFESALKRRAGVKDSGGLLPGHGGVLDRIDSATAVLPVGALLLQWLRTA